LTTDGDWTCSGTGDAAICTRKWGADAFTGTGETSFDSTHLILTKTVAAGCKQTNVDNVDLCLREGHSLEFKCKYPLGETTVKSTFDVAGHDTVASEEGFGSLKYTLKVVNPNVDIGDTVNVEVNAVNKGLVFHHLQDCTVSKSGQDVSILNWDSTNNNLDTVCPNVLGAAIGVSNHKDTTSFSWTAFKWSTSTQAPGDQEQQTITCTISLSQNAPTVNTPGCVSTQDDSGSDATKAIDKYNKHEKQSCFNGVVTSSEEYVHYDVNDCAQSCDDELGCIAFEHDPNYGYCGRFSECDEVYYNSEYDAHTLADDVKYV